MKNLLLSLVLSVSVLLTGCAGLDSASSAKYLSAAATVAATFDVARDRHDRLVRALISHKEVFSEEEQGLLKIQLARLKAVRVNIEALKETHSRGEKVLLGSGVLTDYAELRDAYSIALDIVMSKVDKFSITLKYDVLAQERDVRRIAQAVEVLLAKPDGKDYSQSLNSILMLVKSAAQIAVALG